MNMLVAIFVGLMVALFLFCMFMLWRNERVYAIRMRAIDEAYGRNLDHLYRYGPSYDEMLWSLRKWRFEQFYPELADEK